MKKRVVKQGGLFYLIKIAYRNIYRNKRRSFFCVTAIAIAVFFIIMMMSYVQGIFNSVQNIVKTFEIGDIQLSTVEYDEKKEFLPLQFPIEPADGNLTEFIDQIKSQQGVVAVFPRILTPVTIMDSNVKHGLLWGINIKEESELNAFNLSKRTNGLVVGRYPDEAGNECAIGIRMARNIDVIPSLILTEDYKKIYEVVNPDEKKLLDKYYRYESGKDIYQLNKIKNEDNKENLFDKLKTMKSGKKKKTKKSEIEKKDELNLFRIFLEKREFKILVKIVSSNYSDKFYYPRVTGIFDFDFAGFDKSCILIPYKKLSRLAVLNDKAQTLFVFVNNPEKAPEIAENIRKVIKNDEIVVREWQKHDFIDMFDQVKGIYYIIYGIFIILSSFLIVNTIIMVIYERLKEIGMMGSLGMSRKEIVQLFFMEALLLSLFGAFIGMVIGGIITFLLSNFPINMEALSGGIDFPTNNTIFINFSFVNLVSGFLFGVILSGLCTILPSLKSAFIEPVEALRR